MLLSFAKIYIRTVCIGKAENCGETIKAVLPCHMQLINCFIKSLWHSFIIDLDNCKTCIKYKKIKLHPIVCFPLAKTFNETLATDLEEWSLDKKT